ncbi:hypothetical protein [Saccharothrix sp.]|uniref:hypothetical protein n=1 Tax=Saccharothrix sp. TaxID=1873460 RepID=UPI0028123B90|nr:hypothetical protein [Saccharothrix sp.]
MFGTAPIEDAHDDLGDVWADGVVGCSGQDTWTGWWPGHLDCERLGWMIGPGLPDLARLLTQAVWDPQDHIWTAPPDHGRPR